MPSLTFDPLSESATNRPLEVFNVHDGSIAVDAMSFPAPPLETSTVGSIDTEGDLIAARRHQNRQISLTLGVTEPVGLPAATNLVTNPSFETGTAGWAAQGAGSTIARTTADAHGGDRSLRVIQDGSSGGRGCVYSLPGSSDLTPSVTYTAGVWVKGHGDGIGSTLNFKLRELTAATATVGDSTASIELSDDWQWVTVSRAFGATGVDAALFVLNSSSVSFDALVDGAALVVGDLVASFDGDSPGCAWTGTPYASSSTRPASGGPLFRAILGGLQGKVAKLAADGGTLRWLDGDGLSRTLDVLAADSYEPIFDVAYFSANVAAVTVGLLAKPYARGAEVLLDTFPSSGLGVPFSTTVPGDVPAAGRMLVTETAGIDYNAAHWALETDPGLGASGALRFDLTDSTYFTRENGTVVDSGTALKQSGLTGVYLSLVSWTSLTHTGTYRVLIRARAPNTNTGAADYIRLSYAQNGDIEDFTMNAANRLPRSSPFGTNYSLIDLGLVSLPTPTKGTAEWTAIIEVLGDSGNDAYLDELYLLPIRTACATIYSERGVPVLGQNLGLEIRRDGYDVQKNATNWGSTRYEGDYLKLPAGDVHGFFRAMIGNWTGRYGSDGSSSMTMDLYAAPRYLSFT